MTPKKAKKIVRDSVSNENPGLNGFHELAIHMPAHEGEENMTPEKAKKVAWDSISNEIPGLHGTHELAIHMPIINVRYDAYCDDLSAISNIVETTRGRDWRFSIRPIDYAESLYIAKAKAKMAGRQSVPREIPGLPSVYHELAIDMFLVNVDDEAYWDDLAAICKIIETARGRGWPSSLRPIGLAESDYNT